jgi:hypothetical protein
MQKEYARKKTAGSRDGFIFYFHSWNYLWEACNNFINYSETRLYYKEQLGPDKLFDYNRISLQMGRFMKQIFSELKYLFVIIVYLL